MPEIGILCRPGEQGGAICQILHQLLAQTGLPYTVCFLPLTYPEEAESGERDGLSCLLLVWDDRAQAFEMAERLWEKNPSLQIIYVARGNEDVFAAMQLPFFHLVRLFDLERGLRAALRKLERLKTLLPEKVCFTHGGEKLLVQRKEILYLESQGHTVWLHTGSGISGITENLSQCEEKLKGLDFVRIHRSLLVNMYHIGSLERDSVLLLGGQRLYISRYRYAQVKLEFENYIRKLGFI